ncbi:MAG: hypothetical protein NVSMB16_15150 [Acidimicrobiales bacterium]
MLAKGVLAATNDGIHNDRVLVVLQLGGGNDGLNTVVPVDDGAYHDRRKTIGISDASALRIAPGVGLHPALRTVKARYDAGGVAIVRGVGNPGGDLSHFANMAAWMSGAPANGAPAHSGWLGRYMDGLNPSALNGVAIGDAVPLHMVGERSAASGIPTSADGLFGIDTTPEDQRLYAGIRAMGGSTGLGPVADSFCRLATACLDTSGRVLPAFSPKLTGPSLVQQLTLTARLINANLGIRVFAASHGDHDTHANQATLQAANLTELDAAIAAFYATLDPARAPQVLLSTFAEFGRRVEENGSGGTDHGAANSMLLLSPSVRSGLHGAQPSLTDLDRDGDLKPAIDFRSVYATILSGWLNADASGVLGANYGTLDLFAVPPSGPGLGTPPPLPGGGVRPGAAGGDGYRVVTASGAVAGFAQSGLGDAAGPAVAIASSPSRAGYWVASTDGRVRAFGDAGAHGDLAGTALARPIVGMAATAAGDGYWLLGADGGIFSFGAARFYGSEGGAHLNRDVVAMAAHPGGGYWLVASDGGVFSFGSAGFHGSTGAMKLNQPIVGMAPTSSGNGYWLVASDGGIFAFGDAKFFGSTGAIKLSQPIVGMMASPSGAGYRLVASDGGIFCFGDSEFHGSLVDGGTHARVVGIAG